MKIENTSRSIPVSVWIDGVIAQTTSDPTTNTVTFNILPFKSIPTEAQKEQRAEVVNYLNEYSSEFGFTKSEASGEYFSGSYQGSLLSLLQKIALEEFEIEIASIGHNGSNQEVRHLLSELQPWITKDTRQMKSHMQIALLKDLGIPIEDPERETLADKKSRKLVLTSWEEKRLHERRAACLFWLILLSAGSAFIYFRYIR